MPLNIRKKIRAWIDKTLEGKKSHHLCFLPGKLDFLSHFMMRRFYSGVKIDEHQTAVIKKLPDDAVYVYANKFKTNFEYLLYYTLYGRMDIPAPRLGLDYRIFMWQPLGRLLKIWLTTLDHFVHHFSLPNPYSGGNIREELLAGRAGMLSLIAKKGFYRRFVKAEIDPVHYLVEMQRSQDRPIFIIPQLVFYGKRPERSVPKLIDILFGPEQRPGWLRRLTILIRRPGKVFVEVSEPINLKRRLELSEYCDLASEAQARILRRDLLIQFNRHRQSIVGPVLKSREEMKEDILTSDDIRRFMAGHAENRDLPALDVRKKADAQLEEIAAQYSLSAIKMASMALTWIIRLTFDGISFNKAMLNRVKTMSLRGPVILIPCHKSHIDYLILSYLLFHNDMSVPHIAAGKNLSFWPMGPIFRGCGAFFLRRTFKGAVLYSKIFAGYIRWLLEQGFFIEFFIEGTRSRSGKLLTPKLGLLSILLDAYQSGAVDDLVFAPVFVGYDRVIEESSYLHEIEGGRKEQENLRQVISARKVLKKRYGKIYVEFANPISLKEFLADSDVPLDEMTPEDRNALCGYIGMKMLNRIDKSTVVTAHGLVAAVILNISKKRFSFDEITDHLETCMNLLLSQEARLTDTLQIDQLHAVRNVLDNFASRKFIEREAGGKEDPAGEIFFRLNTSRRPILEYYKNNCISFFVPAAFTALAILERDAFQFSASDLHSGYRFLQEFFKNEFAPDVDKSPEYHVRKTIKAFIDDAILMPHLTIPDTYNITSAGFRKLKFFASFLKTFFESYWIVLTFFMRKPHKSIKPKDRLKKIMSLGAKLYKQKQVDRNEALSKANYKNAVDYFTFHGVKGKEDEEKLNDFSESIRRYIRLLPP